MQQLELQLAANAFRIICFVRWAVQSAESAESPHPGYLHAVIHVCAAPRRAKRSQACCRGRGSAFVWVCACVGVHNCLYATPAACMYLHSHFNLCARRRPTGPQTMSLVLCALTCYMQMRFLPACPATSTHTQYTQDDAVAVVVVTSPAVVAFFCLCCL